MSEPWTDERSEWLEADGLGGYASGTLTGVRTRRYHALLLPATTPPTGRVVLVNGFDAWIETDGETFPLTTQRYGPDVLHPDGASRITTFRSEPWPTWEYRLENGLRIEHSLFVRHGVGAVAMQWRVLEDPRVADDRGAPPLRLVLRPFLSGRDIHATHHENTAFRFDADIADGAVAWKPYEDVPGIVASHNGGYEHDPVWYRNFLYAEERARGLDAVEDLAAPGTLSWDMSHGAAVLVLSATTASSPVVEGHVSDWFRRAQTAERLRRARFASPLHRAADAYIVRRGDGRTIVAGYPWFSDWGRDTFIALRGLCIAGGRLSDARHILVQWADAVSEGMLPNLFVESGGHPEFNSVDASLWYVIAVHDFLAAAGNDRRRCSARDRQKLETAVLAILHGYTSGTRHGIHADADGLLACGEPGVQLTWMDAKVGDWVVTPRTGKPVEVNALWLNALAFGARFDPVLEDRLGRGRLAFADRFWNEAAACLYDVVDVDHVAGSVDDSLRPNQIFAIGGLPLQLIDGPRARSVVDSVERHLLTPLGLRSLAPGSRDYRPRYEGGVLERDGAYHQGTVWPWLMGAFIDAWVRTREPGEDRGPEAVRRFTAPLNRHLDVAGAGHVSEIADAEAPFTPRGCPFQAWSVGELLRIVTNVE